jgi:hypothetical protein
MFLKPGESGAVGSKTPVLPKLSCGAAAELVKIAGLLAGLVG